MTIFFLLFTSHIIYSQVVDIPDPNFLIALLNDGVDTNNDDEIQISEALAIDSLHLGNEGISDLTGINEFQNLEHLLIPENAITDLSFLDLPVLKKLNVLRNGLIELDLGNVPSLVNLMCSENPFVDLDFSSYPNLVILNSSHNNLTEIDVSFLTELEELSIGSNQFTELEISGLQKLKGFYCPHNLLTEITLSNLPALEEVQLNNNQLIDLDLSELNNLDFITAYDNQLTSILLPTSNMTLVDINRNQFTDLTFEEGTDLEFLLCSDNFLTELDVSGLDNLAILNAAYNQLENFKYGVSLSDIDLRGNYFTEFNTSQVPLNAESLNLTDNQFLECLNLKDGAAIEELNLQDCTSLLSICVDDFDLNDAQIDSGVIVGDFCTQDDPCRLIGIQGKTILNNKVDRFNDGCDEEDNSISYLKYSIFNGTESISVFSDAEGNSNVINLPNTYVVKPVNFNNELYSYTPAEIEIDASDPNLPDTISFCFAKIPGVINLCVETFPNSEFRPGFQASYLIKFTNFGADPKSGTIIFNYENEFMDYLNSTPEEPSDIQEGLLTYDYTNIQPDETRYIEVFVELNSPMDDPPLDIDNELKSTTIIQPTLEDIDRTNNFFFTVVETTNSFDPNDKTCLQGSELIDETIGQLVHYMIRFENIGTATTINVVVRDTINLEDFDISTLQISEASHSMETRIIEPNIVEFVFSDINLPFDDDNNDGFVIFKIKTLGDLKVGDEINNSAGIYFDFNFPIITNTATSKFVLPTSIFNLDDNTIALDIFPNPVSMELNFNTDLPIQQYELIDAKGKILVNEKATLGTNHSVDTSSLLSGVYFLKVSGEAGTSMKSFVKN